MWVITWTNGNDTGFHDHDVSGGAVAVVEGEIVEERLVVGGAPRRTASRRGRDVRLRRLARAPDAPGHAPRRRSPSTPTRRRCGGWAPTRWSATARCAGSRSPTPRSCGPLPPSSDLVVLGGGVMGRFTAYHAAEQGARVVILERGRVGDPMTASYGRTRSFRNDYLDTGYARLAHEAFRLWGEFEAETGTEVLVRCGGMNIAKRSVTPDFASTYAEMSYAVLQEAGLETQALDGDELRRRFPFLDADIGRLDVDAGVVNLPAVTETLTRVLGERGVQTIEGVETTAVERDGDCLRVVTDARGVRHALARRDRGPRHQRAAGAPARLRAPGPADEGPAERGQVRHAARGRARALHGGRDAGDRLPRHRDLLPPDHRRPHRGREDRLLQPARHAARDDERRQHREPSSSSACPGWPARRCATSRTSTSATTTSSPTTTSCSAPCRAWRTRSSASAGGAPATSSRRGSGACSPASRSATAPSDDIDRFDPARFLEGGSSDGPSVTADPAAAPR